MVEMRDALKDWEQQSTPTNFTSNQQAAQDAISALAALGYKQSEATKIVDRTTGEVTYGKVPAYSVVVPGSLPNKKNPDGPSLYCAVIVKKVDEKTRSKTSINDLLRD